MGLNGFKADTFCDIILVTLCNLQACRTFPAPLGHEQQRQRRRIHEHRRRPAKPVAEDVDAAAAAAGNLHDVGLVSGPGLPLLSQPTEN